MWFYFHSSQFTVQSERDWRNENNKMFCALSESGNHHGNWKKAIVRNQKSYIIWFILQLLPSAVNNVIEKDFYFLDGLKLEVVSFFHSQIYENFLFTACFVSKVGKCPRFFWQGNGNDKLFVVELMKYAFRHFKLVPHFFLSVDSFRRRARVC